MVRRLALLLLCVASCFAQQVNTGMVYPSTAFNYGTLSTPAISPAGGSYASQQSITITGCGAICCYTTDGSTPTALTPGACSNGTTYSGAFNSIASGTETVEALSSTAYYLNSSVTTNTYAIGAPAFLGSIGAVGDNTASSSQDTSNATLIVITTECTTAACGAPTDSKSNTWTARTVHNSGVYFLQTYYCWPCTVGSGHTFTAHSGSGANPVINVTWYSATLTATDPYDTENFGTTGTGTCTTSTLTPSTTNELIVAGLACGNSNATCGVPTTNNSFSAALNSAGTFPRGSDAYLVDSSSSAIGITFVSGGGGQVCNVTAFKHL